MSFYYFSTSYDKRSYRNVPARALSYFGFCARIFKGLDWYPGLEDAAKLSFHYRFGGFAASKPKNQVKGLDL